eukprot:s467_g19.t2
MSSRTSPAALELQRSVVRERSGGRISVDLLEGIHDFKELPKLQRASGFDQSSPKLLRCGRAVWDRFASVSEVAMLRSYALKAFEGLHHRGAEVSLVLPFHKTCGSMGDSLPKDESLDLAFSFQSRSACDHKRGMERGTPLTGESASTHDSARRTLIEELADGGKRCSVAGDDFEALDKPEPEEGRQRVLSDRVAQSFDQLKRETLLDPGYVQELQQEVPGRLLWLRSSVGLLLQVALFSIYVGLDCGKTIFNSMALKGKLKIVPQSLPICQALLQVIIGISTAFSILGKPAFAEAFDWRKILKFLPVALVFSAAQSFQVLAYTVLSGGTIKILGQVRLLQTALLSKFILGKSYQLTQWTVIGLIVLSAANFCLSKEDDKMRWTCFEELKVNRTLIPQACAMGDFHGAADNSQAVFTYLILSDIGSIMCERLLKDEGKWLGSRMGPYYIQKTWQEIGGFPCAILMSFLVPLLQQFLGVAESRWRPQMWWMENEKCGDENWLAEDEKNLNYCGGFFRNWTWAAAVALLLNTSHSFLSGLVVKKLNSVVKLMGKCASLALVFFVGDCWLLRVHEPSILCMLSAVIVMVGTFTFMNLKPSKDGKAPKPASEPSASVEMPQR